MGNLFAKIVFYAWPLVVMALFATRKGKHSAASTACWSMLLGSMFLPFGVDLDLPVLPGLDKLSWNALWTWIGVNAFHHRDVAAKAPGHQMFRALLGAGIFGVVMTVLNNPDALVYGPRVIDGHSPLDMLSGSIQVYIELYIPFAIGQRLFRTARDLEELCAIFAKALLIYVPFMLWEVRFAPVLHHKIYGVATFGFSQALRGDGYRVSVFMPHGLMLAMFTFAAIMLARALSKVGGKLRPLSAGSVFWIGFGLLFIACRTLAAFLYTGATWFVTWRTPGPRKLAFFLIVVSATVAAYPIARGNGSFPVKELVRYAAEIEEERSRSLAFRFDNEDILLEHANKRPVFGWGAFGRNRIYNAWGEDISITDGSWIITIGTWGYWGFVVEFAFLLLPLMRAAFLYPRVRGKERLMLATLACVCACLTVDLLPNARQDNWTLILTGALWTLAEGLTRARPEARKARPEGAAKQAPLRVSVKTPA